MKIVCISDTHGIHQPKDLPDGDMLIHAGDLSLTGEVHEVQHALAWLRKFPHKYKIVIGGNHDNALCELPYCFDEQFKPYKYCTPLIYLRGSKVKCDDYTVFGSSVIPHNDAFRAGARAYMLDGTTARHWGMAPDCDILVTHGAPAHMRDEGHSGDPCLMAYVRMVKPKLHVFGHCHGGYGISEFEGTIFVNAAQLDGAYRPCLRQEPIVVEI
jgi:predicted phosphodiesterase